MLQSLRLALQENGEKLGGTIEVDETFIGGKSRNMHAAKRRAKIHGTGGTDKEIVFGMVERGRKVRAAHVESRGRKELQSKIREHVEAGAAIFSDELHSYTGLDADYQHAVINHAVEYVNGNVHTNTMENFWSLLTRALDGTYIAVEPVPSVPLHRRRGFQIQQRPRHERRRPVRNRDGAGYRQAPDV